MGLDEAIAAALPQMRAAAESMMRDTCRVRAVTGTTTNGDATVTPTYSTVYEGRCKIQSQRPYPSNPNAGDHQWTLLPVELHLPVDGTGEVGTDQFVDILASADPQNVGRTFRIRSGDRKS